MHLPYLNQTDKTQGQTLKLKKTVLITRIWRNQVQYIRIYTAE